MLTGQTFGRWTVLDAFEKTPKGEKKWLCRCDCGTERYVLERSLLHGGSLSCGCLRKEAAGKAVAHDLTGQSFGDFTVLGRGSRKTASRGIWWRCQCVCGNTCDVLGSLLVTGRKTHCGCKTAKNYAYTDITGKRFGRLVALSPTKSRSASGSIIWRCRCDCGRETEVSYNDLAYSNLKSCGCQKKEHDQLLGKLQTRVDGTSLDIIKSQKIPSDNTTGVRGVYLIKGKYMAKLVFRKKAYYLGTYTTLAEAAQARKEAEERFFQATLDYYSRWQEQADRDPEWARANPVKISVEKGKNGLTVAFLPVLGSTRQMGSHTAADKELRYGADV